MTQEEKQLLLKDLCARLPYGVVVNVEGDSDFDGCLRPYTSKLSLGLLQKYLGHSFSILPYLRPISSMTENEIDKLFDTLHIDKDGEDGDWIKINDVVGIKFFFPTGKWIENVAEAFDYLNSIHIDYLGLIEKSLAIVAPEGMYKL